MIKIYANPSWTIYPINKTDIFHIDDTWSMNFFSKRFWSKNNKGYRYILVVIDISINLDRQLHWWKVKIHNLEKL